ncbi:hypothetical protein KDW_36340 [Dictyobacter vulcani]|uniref:FHA domain-containing protein n=1 Tax=Dictyobacter vulcani TaxID=2607529 RepID=A0A5J4KQK0_9CHLR|nr:FHA domain-containing protein [Dictyobacter vulcani]GER89472.1 hypothetical protein KDW_36340 [Dictyobacter vulcani]
MGIVQKPFAEAAVRFLDGPLAEKVIFLDKPIISLGRDAQNDIVVSDPRVSRHHAVFVGLVIRGLLKISLKIIRLPLMSSGYNRGRFTIIVW